MASQERKMPKPRKREYDSASYRTLKTVSRGLTTLSLKIREDQEPPYYCVAWRDKYPKKQNNRRFYSFWTIGADTAYEMLDEAHTKGLLSSDYDRWPDETLKILDSNKLSLEPRNGLIDETLSQSQEDQVWRDCTDLRIVVCVEPWREEIWRKAMILSPSLNLATFRSLTRYAKYTFKYKEVFLNGWQIDQSMMDADGFIHRTHLEALKRALGK